MKRILYAFAALATTILVAGCARELAPTEVAGETVTATFTVGTPGFATKALSDGSKVDEFIFAVYDESGNYLQELTEAATVSGVNPTWSVSVPVVKDLTYQFLFVAKKSVPSTSTTGDIWTVDVANKTLSIDYSKVAANEDDVDLFYASIKETIGDQLSKTVGLSRPLAQVNVGAADLTAAALSFDVANMTTGFTIEGIYNTIDLLTGKVPTNATAVDVTFAPVARINEGTTEFYTGYKRIALAHVLVGEKQNSTVTFKAVAGSKTVEREVANVPLQQNYRTNILGNIFTGNMVFTVNVEAGFATPDYNVIISRQEQLDAVITAINNHTSTATSMELNVAVDGTVLDFGGLTDPLTIPVTVSSPAANEEPKTVVIENLEATTTTGTTPAVTIQAGASAVIEGADLSASTSSDGRAININAGSTVVIRDSKIDGDFDNSGSRGVNVLGDGSSVSVEDSEIKGMYAINLPSSATDNTIVIEDTKVDGWSIFNVWNSGNTIRFNNCELNSKNIYSGTSNAFGAFVINPNVNNTTIIVNDCDITVTAEGDQPQYLVIIKTGATNSVFRATGNTSIDGTASKTQYVISGYSGMTANDYTIDIDDTVSFDWYSGN